MKNQVALILFCHKPNTYDTHLIWPPQQTCDDLLQGPVPSGHDQHICVFHDFHQFLGLAFIVSLRRNIQSCWHTMGKNALMYSNYIKIKAFHTFTIVISTPARCKIGEAFFSNRLFAFLWNNDTGSLKIFKERTLTWSIWVLFLRFLISYPLLAAGFKITVAFLRFSCGAICWRPNS